MGGCARRALPAGFLAGLGLLGCGTTDPPPSPVPVSGKVVCQERPVPGLVLTFWPDKARGRQVAAPSERDGTFRLHLPPGVYRVTITPLPPSESAPMQTGVTLSPGFRPAQRPSVAGRFQSTAETPLRVTVTQGGVQNVVLAFEP
jgi:hypothetical protein